MNEKISFRIWELMGQLEFFLSMQIILQKHFLPFVSDHLEPASSKVDIIDVAILKFSMNVLFLCQK